MKKLRSAVAWAAALAMLALLASAVPALAANTVHHTRATYKHHHRTRATAKHRRARHATRVHRARTRRHGGGTTGGGTTGGGSGGTTTASGPSGVAMPVGDISGWHQVFADDFSGSSLDPSRWFAYSGQPGGDPGGLWAPSHVLVSNGQLVLAGYRDPAFGNKWVTGGVSSKPGLVQTYGKYEVRFRFDAGIGIAHVMLLWPADNSWPPEVDFSEDNGGNKQTTYATLHWGALNNQLQVQAPVDLTQWHTLGVEWTPGMLVYTLDGTPWKTVLSSNVPSIPMVLDMQTQAWDCTSSGWESCPNSTTPTNVNLDVDWAVAYARA